MDIYLSQYSRHPSNTLLYAYMNMEGYKVEGSKQALNKLIYYWLFISVWYFLQSPLHAQITGCSVGNDACTQEQIYMTLKLQSFSHLPMTLFFIYIGYYSLKVLKQKCIPPKGHALPFSIPVVTKRDHYTFGISGIVIALIAIASFIKVVYYAFSITSI